jgi:hypothetical protein
MCLPTRRPTQLFSGFFRFSHPGFFKFEREKVAVVEWRFYWGYLSFWVFRGGKLWWICGGMRGKRGALTVTFSRSKRRTPF